MRKIAKRIVKLASMKKNAVPGDKLFMAYGTAKIQVSWDNLRVFSNLEFYPGQSISCNVEENLPSEKTQPMRIIGESYEFNIEIEECEVIAQTEEEARKKFLEESNKKTNWSFDLQVGNNLNDTVLLDSTVDEVAVTLDAIEFQEDY